MVINTLITLRFDLFFVLVDECNEVADYAIARRIIDLHSGCDINAKRKYSLEEIQRYLLFSRQFKPKVSQDAQDHVVRKYKHLRQRDSTGVTQSSWRITVRQLESMIRLSEAMARMYCLEYVAAKHVEEAFKLLNKSILRVEAPDIDFTGLGEEELMNGEQVAMEADGYAPDGDNTMEGQQPVEKKLTVTYEEYKQVANLLVMRLRQEEEKEGDLGLTRSELTDWYLGEIEADIESIEQLSEKKNLLDLVLTRLINVDKIIIPLSEMTEEGASPMGEDKAILVVHPNYIIE